MFDGVVVAVDGTRAGNEAGRQAANLVAPGGLIRLVGVADPYSESINEWGDEALLVADAASRDDAPAPREAARLAPTTTAITTTTTTTPHRR